jgi:hypothetical protein
MPSHGVEIIDGIPVYIKSGIMYAFRPENPVVPGGATSQQELKLGTYDAATKKATWTYSTSTGDASVGNTNSWLSRFRDTLVPRSRK